MRQHELEPQSKSLSPTIKPQGTLKAYQQYEDVDETGNFDDYTLTKGKSLKKHVNFMDPHPVNQTPTLGSGGLGKGSNLPEEAFVDEPIDRIECTSCGRKFAQEALEKH